MIGKINDSLIPSASTSGAIQGSFTIMVRRGSGRRQYQGRQKVSAGIVALRKLEKDVPWLWNVLFILLRGPSWWTSPRQGTA